MEATCKNLENPIERERIAKLYLGISNSILFGSMGFRHDAADGHDIAKEAFIKAWYALLAVCKKETVLNLEAKFNRILRNKLVDELRRYVRQGGNVRLEEWMEYGEAADMDGWSDGVELSEMNTCMEAKIKVHAERNPRDFNRPTATLMLVAYHYFKEGMEASESAVDLDMPAYTVESWFGRFREWGMECLEERYARRQNAPLSPEEECVLGQLRSEEMKWAYLRKQEGRSANSTAKVIHRGVNQMKEWYAKFDEMSANCREQINGTKP